MALDSRYVIAPSLQMYFVDKDNGLPLENGKVYFFEDQARTIPKDVFEIVSGSIPGDYTYNVLPNPVSLSSVGTFQDNNGIDIIPYYYPYDDQGNIELYYIEVYDHAGVLQFTREAWPNFTSSNVAVDQDVTNFVPNGQFLLHDNVPASSANGFVAGKISQDVTVIAQGGWTFERGPSSTATDFITFPRYASAIQIPSGNPRYAVQVQTTIAASDTRKDLCLKFPDVNTFASDTQSYNFYFEAESVSGSDITNCQLIVRKYYGTGGSPSPTTESVITTFTLNASTINQYNTAILFGTNAGKSIGTNNDDYVQICLRFPPTSTQTALLTDFAMTVNDEQLTQFPFQTNAQQIDPSTAGWFPTPDPDGYDLYLPAILGPSGLLFDDSSIGQIVELFVDDGNQTGNLLFCDGSAYLSADYSSLGIPYRRLANVLTANSAVADTPMFGTGTNFVTAATVGGQPTKFLLTINGGVPASAPTAGTSGFTIVATAPSYTFTVPTIPAASTYFTFQNTTGTLVDYFVWYQIGSSLVPAISGTPVVVVLNGTETPAQVVTKTIIAINGYQFVLPNLQGYFLRGLGGVDPDSRTLGSIQAQAFLSHVHAGNGAFFEAGAGFSYNAVGAGSFAQFANTMPTGGNETRPVNFAINYFIRY